jgi:hypothetical protein
MDSGFTTMIELVAFKLTCMHGQDPIDRNAKRKGFEKNN